MKVGVVGHGTDINDVENEILMYFAEPNFPVKQNEFGHIETSHVLAMAPKIYRYSV